MSPPPISKLSHDQALRMIAHIVDRATLGEPNAAVGANLIADLVALQIAGTQTHDDPHDLEDLVGEFERNVRLKVANLLLIMKSRAEG